MSKNDRSIIERLDDIEKKIPTTKHHEARPISEVIGRSFADYLNDATVYGIEEDIRKFNKTIKKQKRKSIIFLSLLASILLFYIVCLVINKQLERILIVLTLLAIIPYIIVLIALFKQRNKQPMRSFWNVKNLELYLVNDGEHKKIVEEESNGVLFYILVISKLLAIIVSVGGVLWYNFSLMQSATNIALYRICTILGYIIVLINCISVGIRKPYYFFNYIIETEDSYVTYPILDYFEK